MVLGGAVVTTVLFQKYSPEEIPNMVSCYPNYKGLKKFRGFVIRARKIATYRHIMYHYTHVDS